MTLESGTKLGRYEIRSKIGEGGMGEVYLAEDIQLHRRVALKMLRADIAANQDRMRRFVQEAQATAALNHPNIAHIYEIGESGGVHFIAMEFIDGQTLRESIHKAPTDLKKLLRYLQHSAEGLAKAHAAGIVHRDLKPDNIMITRDGHAKILDFGLAKLLEPPQISGSGSSEVATAILPQHSTPGMILGTVGYMSPEQAQGKTDEIDQRSDIFSFGCILFEAVTGRKAFEGKDAVESLNKIIREPVSPISDLNPSAPTDLQRIVRR
ncbi:MAG: serine/threonine protein kinase, partial [Acidobacteria bacterium]